MSLWNAGFDATPSGSEDRSLGDDRMREIKAVLKERLIKEHNLDIAEAGSQPRQGLHKAGSAVIFSQADAPTLRNGTILGTADVGLVWHDTDDDSLHVWNGAAWVVIPGASLIADTAATPNRVLMRDTAGGGKVTAPAAEDDIALKSTVTTSMATHTAAYLHAEYDIIIDSDAKLNLWASNTTGAYPRVYIKRGSWTFAGTTYNDGTYDYLVYLSRPGTNFIYAEPGVILNYTGTHFRFRGFGFATTPEPEDSIIENLTLNLNITGTAGNAFAQAFFQCANILHVKLNLTFNAGLTSTGFQECKRIEYCVVTMIGNSAYQYGIVNSYGVIRCKIVNGIYASAFPTTGYVANQEIPNSSQSDIAEYGFNIRTV